MQINIKHKPSYAMAVIDLAPGEKLVTESGCMVSMTQNMKIETQMNRSYDPNMPGWKKFFSALWGFFIAMFRKILGGESFFINIYEPEGGPGQITTAPALTGDLVHIPMEGRQLTIQSSSYHASSPTVKIETMWGGLRSLFGGEGVFLLKATGSGDLLVNCYGGLEVIDINGTYTLDSGHMVAFDSTLNYKIKSVGGLKSTLLSGEGLVMEFSGQGKLYIQTRNVSAFVGWLTPRLP
jgi:uncharacterized protein (TIGR00266 family)